MCFNRETACGDGKYLLGDDDDQHAAVEDKQQANETTHGKFSRDLRANPTKERESTEDSTTELEPTEDTTEEQEEGIALPVLPPQKKTNGKKARVSFQAYDDVRDMETEAAILARYYDSKEEADVEAGNQCKFTVHLKKAPEDRWGFHLFYSQDGKHTSFKYITGTPIKEWQENNPTKLIRFGDEVVSFNGQSGDCRTLLYVMRNSNELEIVLRRKLEIHVRTRMPLGVDFVGIDDFEVSDIKGGGIMAYNDSCLPKAVIGPGDILVSVNGMTSNLLAELQKAWEDEEVKLIFKRPSVR